MGPLDVPLPTPWGGGQWEGGASAGVSILPAVLAQAPSAGGHGDVHMRGPCCRSVPRPSAPAPRLPSPQLSPGESLDLAHSRPTGRGGWKTSWIPVTWTDLLLAGGHWGGPFLEPGESAAGSSRTAGASAGQVLRVGLSDLGVGGFVGHAADVFIRGPGPSTGYSCVDGIGHIGEHQPAGPALGPERERGLPQRQSGHQGP